MYITKEKIREIIKDNFPVLSCVIDDDEVAPMFEVVSEILEEEARAIEINEPYATASISRLAAAASEVFNLGREVEDALG